MTWSVRLNWIPAVGSVASTSQYYIDREVIEGGFDEEQIVSAYRSGPANPFILNGDVSYGDSEITLVSVSGLVDIAERNAGILLDAFIRWTSIDVPNKKLQGVTWHGGYGTYLSGSELHWACETVQKNSSETFEPIAMTIWFRLRHSLSGKFSPAAFMPVFFPPAPATSKHCVVAIGHMPDLGTLGRLIPSGAPVDVKVYLEGDEFMSDGLLVGSDSAEDSAYVVDNTYTIGIVIDGMSYVFAQCLKDSARVALTGEKKKYVFDISGQQYRVNIPDADFVTLLSLLTAQ